MVNEEYRKRVKELIEDAKSRDLIKTYVEFCETEESKLYALNEEEIAYYYSKSKEKEQKFKIRDIVFVSNYKYKNGKIGQNHIFVIIDNGKAVEINYFGFLLSSQIHKSNYRYNTSLLKNDLNKLYKDSIVKCDDLIEIYEAEIKFKIGEVTQDDLERFINTYKTYLEKNKEN